MTDRTRGARWSIYAERSGRPRRPGLAGWTLRPGVAGGARWPGRALRSWWSRRTLCARYARAARQTVCGGRRRSAGNHGHGGLC